VRPFDEAPKVALASPLRTSRVPRSTRGTVGTESGRSELRRASWWSAGAYAVMGLGTHYLSPGRMNPLSDVEVLTVGRSSVCGELVDAHISLRGAVPTSGGGASRSFCRGPHYPARRRGRALDAANPALVQRATVNCWPFSPERVRPSSVERGLAPSSETVLVPFAPGHRERPPTPLWAPVPGIGRRVCGAVRRLLGKGHASRQRGRPLLIDVEDLLSLLRV
jgi:hypothetical protein